MEVYTKLRVSGCFREPKILKGANWLEAYYKTGTSRGVEESNWETVQGKGYICQMFSLFYLVYM